MKGATMGTSDILSLLKRIGSPRPKAPIPPSLPLGSPLNPPTEAFSEEEVRAALERADKLDSARPKD